MQGIPRLVLCVALASGSFSQSTLYNFDGDSIVGEFGWTVSGAGDVNGDGFDDLIVGARFGGPNSSGRTRVFSGLDGSVLYTFDGDSDSDLSGWSVSGAGDVNGDGFADVIVGAIWDDNNAPNCGSARVYSGLDGSTLYTFDGDSKEDHLGVAVSGAGDVNGDGRDDLIVGAHLDDDNGFDSGSARVFSGLDGSILYTFHGDSAFDLFGESVSGAGDVNGDGFADLLVGGSGDDHNGLGAGIARVFSGLDGSILHTFVGDAAGDALGFSVNGAGDVNRDGFADVIVGAWGDDTNGQDSGSARVFSGVDGSVLYVFRGDDVDDVFGWSVSGAGDVDGDGYADLIVGAPLDDNRATETGSARVFSGRDGSVLYTHDGDSQQGWFGNAVSGAGDVNADGRADLIVGAMWDDDAGYQAGSARVISGCDALGTNYCGPANLNSTNQSAVISACGSDLADGSYFMLLADNLPPGQFGYFLASETQAFVPFAGGSQGNLCLGGQIARFTKQVRNSGPSGHMGIEVDLTNIPTTPPHTVVAGETWNFQAWFRDKNPGATSNFTDGVSVAFH